MNVFYFRAIRASHILVTANGKSMITGFRYSVHMVEGGKRKKCIHCFPTSAAVNLNWLSPELLEQVCNEAVVKKNFLMPRHA